MTQEQESKIKPFLNQISLEIEAVWNFVFDNIIVIIILAITLSVLFHMVFGQ